MFWSHDLSGNIGTRFKSNSWQFNDPRSLRGSVLTPWGVYWRLGGRNSTLVYLGPNKRQEPKFFLGTGSNRKSILIPLVFLEVSSSFLMTQSQMQWKFERFYKGNLQHTLLIFFYARVFQFLINLKKQFQQNI